MKLRRITFRALAIIVSLAQATQVGLTTNAVEPASRAKRVHHYVFFGQDPSGSKKPGLSSRHRRLKARRLLIRGGSSSKGKTITISV
jgi:hypothetical protein